MANYKPITKPVKGLVDTNVNSALLDGKYATSMQNIAKYGDYFGKRQGRSEYGTVTGAVMGYYHFKLGDYNKFIKFTVDKIATRSSSGWTDVTGTDLTGDLDNFIDACTVYDSVTGTPYVVFTNGKDNIRKYTGTGNTSDLSAWTSYKCRFVRYYKGYLGCFHLIESGVRNGFRFRCSDTDKPNDSTGINSKTFNLTQDKNISDIMRVEYYGDYLAVYKTDCIYLLWLGSSVNIFDWDVAVHQTGLRASRAVAVYKDGSHFFLGYDDFYHWGSPSSAPQGLTNRAIKKALFTDTSPNNLKRAWCIYDQATEKIRLYVPETNYMNRVYVLDLTENEWSWWQEKVNNITAVGAYLPSTIVTIDDLTGIYGTIDGMTGVQIDSLGGALTSNFPLLIEGDVDGNSWYENADEKNDGNITIKSNYVTGDEIYTIDGVPFTSDRSMGIRFEAKGDAVYVYYSTDEGETWTQITAGLSFPDLTVWNNYLELTDEWNIYEAHIDVMSPKIRYKFVNEINNSTFFIRNIAPISEDGEI